MSRTRSWVACLLAVMACGLAVSYSSAVFMARLPLKAALADSQFIVVAKVEKLYPDKPAMVVSIVDDLKGKMPFRKLPVNLTPNRDLKKDLPLLLKVLNF